jgi:hypothetical protein
MTGVHPKIIFPRDKSSDVKPIISDFTREVAPLSNYHSAHIQATGNLESNDPVPSNDTLSSNDPMPATIQSSSNDPMIQRLSSSQSEEGHGMDTEKDDHVHLISRAAYRTFAIGIQNELEVYSENSIPSEEFINAIQFEEDLLDELGIEDLTLESDDDESNSNGQVDTSTTNTCEVNESMLDDEALFTGHPWEVISSIPENKTICVSPSGCIPIRKKDAETLLHGRWLNDKVLNFFVENINSSRADSDTKYDCFRRSYLTSSWLFAKMFNVTTHGELGRYS